jgi:glycine/D-amino acid oxidase-like deaminating enzyme
MKRSVWETESFFAPATVAIVGGGLLGLWTARELKINDPNLKVTLIDAGTVPTGASTRNAGFACFGSPSELLHDAQTDESAMWQTVEWRFKGIQKIKALFNHAIIDYNPCGGFECYEAGTATAPNADALAWLNAGLAGITQQTQTFAFAGEKLAGLGLQGFDQLVENPLEAGLHSGKLVQALQQLVVEMGVKLVSGTSITRYEKAGDMFQLFDNERHILSAERVVFAVNGFSHQWFPQLNIAPARGQILLTPPIDGLALRGTFHFDEGFYYWRNLDSRILLGGARNHFFEAEATINMETSDEVQANLFAFLQRHIPESRHLKPADCQSWAGIMGMSQSKQPTLQKMEAGLWAAHCCNGMGVALAPIWAEKVAEAILG